MSQSTNRFIKLEILIVIGENTAGKCVLGR